MPLTIVFLETDEPLAAQVAKVLLREKNGLPLDLGDTQVWVPTAGSGRRIRAALAATAGNNGVLSPAFLQPMQALLPESENYASRSEREAAWAAVFRDAPEEEWDQLLPDRTVFSSVPGTLGVAGVFCDLCDLLVEGALSPASPLLEKVCAEDSGRWQQLQPLYRGYLARLAAENRTDPNDARLHPETIPPIRRVFVACIPDLPRVAEKYLSLLAEKEVAVTILVWKPNGLPAGWDAWGRPLPEEWNICPLDIADSQIQVSRQVNDEAGQVLDYLALAEMPGDYALALADETLGASFSGEIGRRDGIPFLPQGRPLTADEAAKIALEWEDWRTSGEFRTVRTLLQCPQFSRWLAGETRLYPSQLLAACDFLITAPLAETLGQAASCLRGLGELEENSAESRAQILVTVLEKLKGVHFTKILQTFSTESASSVLHLWQEISTSPFYMHWPEGRLPAFARALRSENSFGSAPEQAVELSGWLETPWLEASRLAICGCAEGNLPTSVTGHPFLPDSKRTALGLADNESRLARDAYLLTCLLARHRREDLLFSFSRFDAEGSPSLPSRLLLRTTEPALPARVQQVFAPVSGSRKQPGRTNHWRWSLPPELRKGAKPKISPTQCRAYLSCPTRFYWQNILHLDIYDPDPREMDAMRFGSLIHSALEMFGLHAPHESRADVIEKLVLEELDCEARKIFGSSPTAAVRVQLEAARVRLKAFARVQTEEYAAGWRILEVEKQVGPQSDTHLFIGPMELSAKIDRIERHPELGLRVVDYKTSNKNEPPLKKHLGPARSDHFLPASQMDDGKKGKSWIDLQLPLYRHIVDQLYPGENIQTAYFGLPADPAETKVVALDIDEDAYQSAIHCAEVIATNISKGIFWPPQLLNTNWEDAAESLFINGKPEDCFDVETIAFLKGTP